MGFSEYHAARERTLSVSAKHDAIVEIPIDQTLTQGSARKASLHPGLYADTRFG